MKTLAAGDGAAGGAGVAAVGTLASGLCAELTQAVKTKPSATPSKLDDVFMSFGARSEPAFVSDVNRGVAYAAAIAAVEPSASFRLRARRAFGLRAQATASSAP
jgi:hypothetical protein